MPETLSAPVAERRAPESDPYAWLRQKADPAVMAYLEAENAYTADVTAPLRPLEDTLYQEMLGRIQQTDLSVPIRRGRYLYYSRTVEGLQYPIHCRKRAPEGNEPEGPEEILLDMNEQAKGLAFFSLGAFEISDDAQLLAYTTDITGMRQYQLHVKNLDTGALLPDTDERVTSIEWANDNRTLFYSTEDAVTKRSDRLFRRRLGEAPVEIYHEADELYNIGVQRTRDHAYLLLGIGATDSTEFHYLRGDAPESPLRLFFPRQRDHKYDLDHRDGLFYVRTNLHAKNFRVVTVPVAEPRFEQGREFLPHDPAVLLEGLDLFRDYAVAHEKTEGLNRLRVHTFATRTWRAIPFPEPVYSAFGGGNPENDTQVFRYSYQSMVTPPGVYEYGMDTGTITLLKQQPVLGGYDASQYRSERLWVTARDGVRVPLSAVYKPSARTSGPGPLLLYGYGSYGYGVPAGFSVARLSLLDRGVVYVTAHIRGGNEMGEAWHDDGMLMKKKNTFFDFIDAAEFLIRESWTSADKLAIEGGSAGGLLIGAVVNLRPELFGAAHLAVPFVDVMNTMLDASLPLTVGEYLEWGDPNQPEAAAYMRSYSPYDNLAARDYPAILVTTSLNDSQVMYWEPVKYVAKLRHLKTNDTPLLLKTNLGAGHGGASGRYDKLHETAFEFAWLLSQIAG